MKNLKNFKKEIRFPETTSTTSQLKDLLTRLLAKDPRDRIGWKDGSSEIKNHPWFKIIDFDIEKKDQQKIELMKRGLRESEDPMAASQSPELKLRTSTQPNISKAALFNWESMLDPENRQILGSPDVLYREIRSYKEDLMICKLIFYHG